VEVVGVKGRLQSYVEIPEYVYDANYMFEFRVTSIGDKAFNNCRSLYVITIPEGVKSIGEGAFYNCRSLYEITIPEGVTSIGNRTFYNCYSLEEAVIPSSVNNIGDSAFYNCSSLLHITIPERVKSIGKEAFRYCLSLESVAIPNSVTSIEEGALYNCYSLENISLPDSISMIKPMTFAFCYNLKSVNIPEGVTSVGLGAFWLCESLSSIEIPNSVTSIEPIALTEAGVYNNKSNWEDGVLYINKCLIKVSPTDMVGAYTIKPGTRLIASDAFGLCKSMTSLSIPSSVTNIGCGVFYKCKSLTAIDYAGTKEQWHKIKKDAYWNSGSKIQVIRCIDGEVEPMCCHIDPNEEYNGPILVM
jgi:hypothetical protein